MTVKRSITVEAAAWVDLPHNCPGGNCARSFLAKHKLVAHCRLRHPDTAAAWEPEVGALPPDTRGCTNCGRILSYFGIRRHERSCSEDGRDRLVSCPQRCGQEVAVSRIRSHLLERCSLAVDWFCPRCLEVVPLKDCREHRDECEGRPGIGR